MKGLFILFSIFIVSLVNGQEYAITDDGKRVKLNDDGTWESIQKPSQVNNTTYIFIDGRKLVSGEKTSIHTAEDFAYDTETYITVAKEREKTIIVFWQESLDQQLNSPWTGNVILYLDNNETIKLIDRGIKGNNKIKGSFSRYNGLVKHSTIHQIYSAYYLTDSECNQLKQSNLSQISYQLYGFFGLGETIYMSIFRNSDTIKQQLYSIGR
ncbi:MAG: hypothetical protein H8E98_05920 [Bacteroidetes bacterium]|nr:hypothetical protein [Bacteroidota bacterium]